MEVPFPIVSGVSVPNNKLILPIGENMFKNEKFSGLNIKPNKDR